MRGLIKLGFLFLGILFILIGVGDYVKNQKIKNENFMPDESIVLEIENKEKEENFEEKLRQMFVVGIKGEDLSKEEVKMIKEGIGGIILFEKNILNRDQTRGLNDKILQYGKEKGLVPLIAIDYEGGKVKRINWLDEKEKAQKEIKDIKEAYKIGLKRNRDLKELGFNINLAPVVEKVWNEKSFINLGERAFLSDNVNLTKAYLEGCRQTGIICVVKHFPGGLGRVITDPHKKIPIIEINKKEMDQDLEIFKELIKENVKGIMVSHLYYPKIDEENLSSASYVFIGEILKKEIGFEGLIWVDEVKMGAVVEKYDLNEFCLKTIKAGANIIILKENGELEDILNYLNRRINNDIELRNGITASFTKIKKWKELL